MLQTKNAWEVDEYKAMNQTTHSYEKDNLPGRRWSQQQQPTPSSNEEDKVEAARDRGSNNVREKKQRNMKQKEEVEEQREEEKKTKQRKRKKWSGAEEKESDSYERVTVPLYIKWLKDNLAISLRVLGVPGAQSNTQLCCLQ